MTEPAFNGAGKTPGFELWRIEKFAPVKQPSVSRFVELIFFVSYYHFLFSIR